jgi:hypothetical protein
MFTLLGTRPNISYDVSNVTKFTSNPKVKAQLGGLFGLSQLYFFWIINEFKM